MKAIKIIFWVLAVLSVLAVGAVVVVTNLVDPNDYKPKISSLVKSATGRDLGVR